MSRGIGSLQRDLLSAFGEKDDWIAVNDLSWRLGGGKVVGAQLSKALPSLSGRGYVGLLSRTLSDFADVVRFFPFKTHDAAVKQVREQFLPILATYVPRGDQRFGVGKNETYSLRDHPHLPNFARRWLSLEEHLLDLARADGSRRGLVLPIIWRARQLLDIDPRVRDDRSLRYLVDDAVNDWSADAFTVSVPAILVEVRSFCDELFPDAGATELRRVLHELVDMNKNGPSVLKDEAKMHLLQHAPEMLRAMPGHRGPSNVGRGFGEAIRRREAERTTFDPIMNQVLTRKVFESFAFARLTPAGRRKRDDLENLGRDV